MASKTLLSVEEFLKLPSQGEDGSHYELDEGELVTLPPAGFDHSEIVVLIGAYLRRILGKEYSVVGGEAGIFLPNRTVRGAHVAVLRRPNPRPTGFLREPFLVAFEVVAAEEDAGQLERKINQFLGGGIGEVWVVYTGSENIHVRRAERPDNIEVHHRGARVECRPLGLPLDTDQFFPED